MTTLIDFATHDLVNELHARLTEGRATNLDLLDAAVSSRQSAADALAQYNALKGVASAPFLSTMRAYLKDEITDATTGRWVRLGGQVVNTSNPVYATLLSNAPMLGSGADILPVMASNTTPAPYVATASSFQGSNIAYMAFDSSDSSLWVSASNSFSAGVGMAWVQIKLPAATQVNAYEVAAETTSPNPPIDFKLQGSNDSSNWVDLDSRTGVVWPANMTRKRFDLTGVLANYLYYRLYVTRSVATAVDVRVGRVLLYGGSNYTLLNTYDATSKSYLYVQTREAA